MYAQTWVRRLERLPLTTFACTPSEEAQFAPYGHDIPYGHDMTVGIMERHAVGKENRPAKSRASFGLWSLLLLANSC
jgi:hypothetical protein